VQVGLCKVGFLRWDVDCSLRDSSSHLNRSCHTYECVASHMRVSHVIDITESCLTYE